MLSLSLVYLAFTEDRLRRFLCLALCGDVSSDKLFGPQKVRRDLKQANQELNTVSRAGPCAAGVGLNIHYWKLVSLAHGWRRPLLVSCEAAPIP